jgi:hypothetical protein
VALLGTWRLRSGSGTSIVRFIRAHARTHAVWTNDEADFFFLRFAVAAVAGDMIAFERMPPKKPDGTDGTIAELVLHQYFLSLFGMSVGELWDLKALSEKCKELGRYSFLLTSAPLNVPGSIGSPPNALALF